MIVLLWTIFFLSLSLSLSYIIRSIYTCILQDFPSYEVQISSLARVTVSPDLNIFQDTSDDESTVSHEVIHVHYLMQLFRSLRNNTHLLKTKTKIQFLKLVLFQGCFFLTVYCDTLHQLFRLTETLSILFKTKTKTSCCSNFFSYFSVAVLALHLNVY